MRAAQEQAHDDAKQADSVRKQIAALDKKISDTRLGTTLQDVYKILDIDLNKQIKQLAALVKAENAREQLLSLFAGLPLGTNLRGLGITPQVLKDLGLPKGLVPGTTSAEDALLRKEIANVSHEIHDEQIELKHLHGKQREQMLKHMEALIKEVIGLKTALNQNTNATNANTSSNSTGTTAYSYNGQNILASDDLLAINVGA